MTDTERQEALTALYAVQLVANLIPGAQPWVGLVLDVARNAIAGLDEDPSKVLTESREALHAAVLDAMAKKFPNE